MLLQQFLQSPNSHELFLSHIHTRAVTLNIKIFHRPSVTIRSGCVRALTRRTDTSRDNRDTSMPTNFLRRVAFIQWDNFISSRKNISVYTPRLKVNLIIRESG